MSGSDDLVARLEAAIEEIEALVYGGKHDGSSSLARAVTTIRSVLASRDKEIERLTKDLRTVQNAAKTLAACQGTELRHLRENYTCDHFVTGGPEADQFAASPHWEEISRAAAPAGIDPERACRAAEAANHRFGQWMPQRWLDLFIRAYNDGSAK